MSSIKRMTTVADIDEALGADVAVIYKHSPICNLSASTHQQVHRFVAAHPDARVYIVDVVANRDVSREIADRLGIHHQSPQAIVLRGGEPVWNASHLNVTATALADQLAS